ncbi:hypothetical protein ETB97_007196 [Aspergillus alliaceus]|uniref:Uncharacterized protein n=1 Tax=Petromyces alliaceus TaxID=209559 RepID=A0A8H6A889_PETAA|nr:hypothetical protein ETB97_007196 [Aspergillus burnettii]
MHLSRPLFCTLIAAAVVVGTDIDSNDIPTQCQQVCAAVVSLTATCDRKTDDDKQEQDCICKDSQAPTSIPLCEACIAQNSRDGHDNGNLCPESLCQRPRSILFIQHHVLQPRGYDDFFQHQQRSDSFCEQFIDRFSQWNHYGDISSSNLGLGRRRTV